MDLIIGNSREANAVFMNNENGRAWRKIQLSEETLNTYDIMSIDLNGDKKLDIIESNSDAYNLYYFNRIEAK